MRSTAPTRGSGTGDGERGAVLILTAATLTVLVIAVALTVDIGRVATVRRDLQSRADAVALDVARRLDGSVRSDIQPIAEDAFANSLDRNGVPIARATLDLGTWDRSAEEWTSAAADDVPTEVRVEITEEVEHGFMPGSTRTSRMAVASSGPALASHCVGSFAARVETGSSPILEPLLGSVLGSSVDLVGYRGVAGGLVGLDALLTELDVSIGTVDEVLDTSVTHRDLILALASALEGRGDLVRADILEAIAAGLPEPDVPIRLGDLVAIGSGGPEAAATAEIDAFDLLVGSALVATSGAAIDVPGVAIGLPGLATVDARVRVIEAPRCLLAGASGDSISTAQVEVEIRSDLGVLGLVRTELSASVQVAEGSSTVVGVTCRPTERLSADVERALATTSVGFDLEVDLLGLPVSVPVTASVEAPGAIHPVDLTFPPDSFHVAHQVPTPGLGLGGASLSVGSAAAPVLAIVGPFVDSTLSPLVDTLDTLVLTPLLRDLGVTTAGIDLTPLDVSCGSPALVG